MLDMGLAESLRNKDFEGQSQRLAAITAEYHLGLPVEDANPSVLIYRHDRIGGRLNKASHGLG